MNVLHTAGLTLALTLIAASSLNTFATEGYPGTGRVDVPSGLTRPAIRISPTSFSGIAA